jgi:hypothetical protein
MRKTIRHMFYTRKMFQDKFYVQNVLQSVWHVCRREIVLGTYFFFPLLSFLGIWLNFFYIFVSEVWPYFIVSVKIWFKTPYILYNSWGLPVRNLCLDCPEVYIHFCTTYIYSVITLVYYFCWWGTLTHCQGIMDPGLTFNREGYGCKVKWKKTREILWTIKSSSESPLFKLFALKCLMFRE